jgi:hypothetical protein
MHFTCREKTSFVVLSSAVLTRNSGTQGNIAPVFQYPHRSLRKHGNRSNHHLDDAYSTGVLQIHWQFWLKVIEQAEETYRVQGSAGSFRKLQIINIHPNSSKIIFHPLPQSYQWSFQEPELEVPNIS